MKKYLDCEEIFKKWKIKKLELFECVKGGLQPYSADTGKPIPCSNTMQGELRWIKGALNVIKKYQKSPASLTREEEDWLLAYDESPQKIIDECENERKIIKSKMKKLNISEGDTEDSWKNFHYDASEKMMKFEIDELFERSLFLDSEVEKILASENKIRLDKLNAVNKTKSASKDPFVKNKVFFKQLIPEIEFIYEEIKKNPGAKMKDAEKFWEAAVLNKFDDNRKSFKIIKQSDLAFDDLYALSGSNIKRDFVGRLCQIVMERCGLVTVGIERTYKNYKKIQKG